MSDKNILHTGINKIFFSMLTQFFIMICSLIIGFVLPKYMGTRMYGYWQVYYFYLGYVNLATLGFNDGFSLRYAGKDKKELPASILRGANRLLFMTLFLLTALFAVLISTLFKDPEMKFIYLLLISSIPCVCIINVIVTIYLSINRQAVYNRVNLANKLVSTVLFILLFAAGIFHYRAVILSDFAVRLGITIICLMIGREFIIGKRVNYSESAREVYDNCAAGIFITAGALASSFIPMAGRIIIEHNESIEVYGLYSFAMSLLGIVLTFTNTAGMVFFPVLKTLSLNKISEYYKKLDVIYSYILFVALLAYIPVELIIKTYLSEYQQVLSYSFILFALCIPLGRVQLLITAYYKAYRMEKLYFVFNIAGAFGMLIGTWSIYRIFHTVLSVSITTVIIFTIWSILLEKHLLRRISLRYNQGIIEEVLIMLIFILLSGYGNRILFILGYVLVMIVLLVFKFKNLKILFHKNYKKINI